MKLDTTTASERDKPIYNSFNELKADGFTLSPGICVFIASVHTAALVLGVWLYAAAPTQWMWAGTAWLIAHFLLGSFLTAPGKQGRYKRFGSRKKTGTNQK